jgi:hypothetical protein
MKSANKITMKEGRRKREEGRRKREGRKEEEGSKNKGKRIRVD